jgi:hypothetical protein
MVQVLRGQIKPGVPRRVPSILPDPLRGPLPSPLIVAVVLHAG